VIDPRGVYITSCLVGVHPNEILESLPIGVHPNENFAFLGASQFCTRWGSETGCYMTIGKKLQSTDWVLSTAK